MMPQQPGYLMTVTEEITEGRSREEMKNRENWKRWTSGEIQNGTSKKEKRRNTISPEEEKEEGEAYVKTNEKLGKKG